MSEDERKKQIAAMTRKELNSHAYLCEKEQEEYEETNNHQSKQLELAMNAIYKYSEMIVIDGEDRPQDVGQVAREALEAINRLAGGNETP